MQITPIICFFALFGDAAEKESAIYDFSPLHRPPLLLPFLSCVGR